MASPASSSVVQTTTSTNSRPPQRVTGRLPPARAASSFPAKPTSYALAISQFTVSPAAKSTSLSAAPTTSSTTRCTNVASAAGPTGRRCVACGRYRTSRSTAVGGSDLLALIGYFLELTIQSHKGVVLLGAAIPPTSYGADGFKNLICALNLVLSTAGVYMVFDNKIYQPRYTVKQDATSL